MADKKITQLTALTAADNADLLVIVDVSANLTKKITYSDLIASTVTSITGNFWKINGNTLGNDTSWIGTSNAHDFTIKTSGTAKLVIDKNGVFGFNTAIGAGAQYQFGANALSDGVSIIKTQVGDSALSIYTQGATSFGVRVQSSGAASVGYRADISATGASVGSWEYKGVGTAPSYIMGSFAIGADPYVYDDSRIVFYTDGTSSLGAGHSANYTYLANFISTASTASVYAHYVLNVLCNGNIGVHTLSPTALLHLLGTGSSSATFTFKAEDVSSTLYFSLRNDKRMIYVDGNQTAGYVLTCDANGVATWQAAAGGGGSGTVTTVSVVTNQGVSGSVANATTTPAITLTLGALTGVTSFNGLVVTANTGAITTGSWAGTVIPGQFGGTGVANTGFTITLAGNLATTGAFNTTLAAGFTGTLTLPTATATLATLALAEAFTNKTITSSTNTIGGVTMGLGSDAVGDIHYSGTSNVLTRLASVSAGSYLRSGGVTTAPLWSTLKLPNSATANYITYATATNTLGESANFQFDGTQLGINCTPATGSGAYAIDIVGNVLNEGPGLRMTNYANGGANNNIIFIRAARGSLASPTINAIDDNLFFFGVQGGGTSGAFKYAGTFQMDVDGTPNSTSVASRWVFKTSSTASILLEAMRIDSSQRVGIGVTSPTAMIHIKAGTATAGTAPIKLTAGTNLATPENGTWEFNGTNLFFTRAGTVRENVLVAIDNVAAPSTSVGVGIVNYYGASATNFLGDPVRWLSVNVLGSTYKIPLYS